jgi:hypothetical protein
MTAAMFAIGALTESWRYLYYHLLIGIVTVPLYLLYLKSRPKLKD